jgi:hypothetical protein
MLLNATHSLVASSYTGGFFATSTNGRVKINADVSNFFIFFLIFYCAVIVYEKNEICIKDST